MKKNYLLFLFVAVLCSNCFAQTTTKKANIPFRAYNVKTVTYADTIFVFGGTDDGGSSYVYKYDPSSDTWEKKAPFPYKNAAVEGAGLYEDKIYALINIGESDNYKYLVIGAFDPQTNNWSKIDSVEYSINAPGVVFDQGNIFIAGGFVRPNMSSYLNVATVKKYNIANKQFTTLSPMPVASHGIPMVANHGKLLLLGGIIPGTGGFNDSQVVQEYDVATDKWTRKTDLSIKMANTSLVASGEKAYFFFCLHSTYPIQRNFYEYDIDLKKLTKKTSISGVGEFGASIAMWNNHIYVFGGSNYSNGTSTYSKLMYDYQLLSTAATLLDNPAKPSISVYPNPFTDRLNFKLDNNTEQATIEFFNASGQKTFSCEIAHQTSIETTRFQKGIYYYRVKLKNGTILKAGQVLKTL